MTGSSCRVRVALVCALLVFPVFQAPDVGAADGRLTLLGEHSFPSGGVFQGTTVGGLSGIAYDGPRNVYYAVADDRSEMQPARFYTLQIDVGPGGIGGVRVVGVTTLDGDAAAGIQPYERNALDPEEIVLTPEGELIISSERDQQGRPWIRRFALDGTLLGDVPVPDRFMPESQTGADGKSVQVRGVRSNLGFEGITLTPDGRSLYVSNEESLAQDGPIATFSEGTVIRILRYASGPSGWQPTDEVAYRTERIFSAPEPDTAFADNGVSAMLYAGHLWQDTDLLAMERSFSTGVGNNVWIFGGKLGGAQNTAMLAALPSPYGGTVVSKVPLVRMSDVGIKADNLEGMTFGPRLPNGKPTLIVISDDNFSAFDPPQVNQFVLFELSETAAQPTTPPPLPPGLPPAPMPTAGPGRPTAPVQMPSALPRTGTLAVVGPLAGFGVMLISLGVGLRWVLRRRVTISR